MDPILHELSLAWDRVAAVLILDTARLSEPDMVARLTLQLFLLLGAAFFSASETALFSLSRLDLQKLRRERNRHSETLHELLDQPRRLIISILCGNEVVHIAASANMAGILVALYGPERAGLFSVFVMVPLLLLFCEVTPKTIAVSNPVRVSTGLVAGPMSVWLKVVTPVLWVIRGISDRITTLLAGEEKSPENILQIDEFRTLVETGAKEGQLTAVERALIHNLLESGDTEIVEIMTPRARTKFISDTMNVTEALESFREYRHPRVPVYRGSRDNLVGFLHAEDLLPLILDGADLETLTLAELLRPPVVAPLTKKVDEMFDFFQANKARAAAVLNEFGGVEGFVTMKDVLTFIFGQISGDVRGQELYQERDENVYEVPGEMKLTDFNNLTHFGLEDPRMTTIGGVAFRHLDRMPKVGDRAVVEGFVVTVLELEAHRIARVRVARGESDEAKFDEEAQQDFDDIEGSENAGTAAGPESSEPWPEEAPCEADLIAERAQRGPGGTAHRPPQQGAGRPHAREAMTEGEE